MPIILFIAIAAIMFNAMTLSARNQEMDAPKVVAEAAAEVNEYRMFMFLASQYMSTYSGSAGIVTWQSLITVPIAPSGVKNVSVPPTWRLVVSEDRSWVACTPMSERATGIVEQLAVAGGQTLNAITTADTNYIVVGSTADISKSALCN